MLTTEFFTRDAITVAQELLGKVLRVKYYRRWLSAMIIETEAYFLADKASHASLGFTTKRKALFMPPGTIYMYYARGGDSLNVSCLGAGNAVLIKSAVPYMDALTSTNMIAIMQRLNPIKFTDKIRPAMKLCSGQTLLCRSLNLKVPVWDQQQFDKQKFYVGDVAYRPQKIIRTTRLGIPAGRDEHLHYRFIDYANVKFCTSNPLRKERGYTILEK
jgi:DNA-3-methyladenine glycosylase